MSQNRAQARATGAPKAAEVTDLPLSRNAVAIVPPEEMFTSYISRKVAGVDDMAMFDYAFANKLNVLIEGPTGAGKTSASLAYAAKKKLPFYATPSSIGLEPSQLFGRYIPTEDGHFKWQDGPVTDIVRHGGLLLINEINFIPERVSTVLFSLLDKRRNIQLLDHEGEVIVAHPNLLIVADMNPDYRGTRPLNAALRNRFSIIQHWDYDPKVEKALVPYDSVHTVAEQIRASDSVYTPVSTNMLADFVTQATSPLGWEFGVACFVDKFAVDERPTVQQLFVLHKDNLQREILKLVPDKVMQDDEEEWDAEKYDLTVVGTPDNPNPLNYPGWTPEMGVYGKDWNIQFDEDEDGA